MPELKTRGDIKDWLTTQPRDVILVFAARAALRAAPFLRGTGVKDRKSASAFILPCLWAVDLRAAADAAAAAAAAANAGAAANFWAAINADTSFVDGPESTNNPALSLSKMPLWPFGRKGMPKTIAARWETMAK